MSPNSRPGCARLALTFGALREPSFYDRFSKGRAHPAIPIYKEYLEGIIARKLVDSSYLSLYVIATQGDETVYLLETRNDLAGLISKRV